MLALFHRSQLFSLEYDFHFSLALSHDHDSDIRSFMRSSIGLLKRIVELGKHENCYAKGKPKSSKARGRDRHSSTYIHIEYICAHISFIMLLVASLHWVVLIYKLRNL